MKPIATVHWQKQGKSESMDCNNQEELSEISERLMKENKVFYTSFTSLQACVPSTKPRSVREAI